MNLPKLSLHLRLAAVLLVALVALFVLFRLAQPMRGYTDRVSYAPGDTVRFYLDGGLWPRQRPVPLLDAAGNAVDTASALIRWQRTRAKAPWYDGFGWRESGRYALDLPGGVYLWDGSIPFVVRAAPGTADVLVVYPSNTINAYAQSGGRSLYVMNRWKRLSEAARRLVTLRWQQVLPGAFENRARTVSFERPMDKVQWHFFEPFLAWMSRQPFRTAYVADADLDDPATLQDVRVLVIPGHSEYWTRQARRNVDAFVARGGHLAVFSGNTMWWQVRYDDQGRLVCYKVAEEDPTSADTLRTITWDSAALDYPIEASLGASFPRGGYGGEVGRGFRLIQTGRLFEGLPIPADSIYDGPAAELDGAPLLAGRDDVPVPDTALLGFHRFALFAYHPGERFGEPTVGTMHAFQKSPTSGWVFHAGSTDWTGATFAGADSVEARALTRRVIELMLKDEPLL